MQREKPAGSFQGQSVYKANADVGKTIKAGDQLYLDAMHKDHLEVFDRNGNFRAVLNLDGTINRVKTEAATVRRLPK